MNQKEWTLKCFYCNNISIIQYDKKFLCNKHYQLEINKTFEEVLNNESIIC